MRAAFPRRAWEAWDGACPVAPLAGANSAAEGTLDAMSLRGFDQQVDADGIAARMPRRSRGTGSRTPKVWRLILPVAKNRARRSPVVPEVNSCCCTRSETL